MKNENGFILPIVAILAFLFAAILIYQVELLESDYRFLKERKNYFLHDTLLQRASLEMLTILEKSDTIEKVTDQLTFEDGSVIYKVTEDHKNETVIQLTSTTDLPGKREIFLVYDKETKRISEWSEGIQ